MKTEMKKIASLLLMIFVLVSCETDVTRNDPAFQAQKDDALWRAKTSYAELAANQSVTITGISQFETVILQVQSVNPGTYALGVNNANKAFYQYSNDDIELAYETVNGENDGQVIIDDYDPITMKISGTFRFNANNMNGNPLGPDVTNFQYGVFYKVPVVPAL